MGKLKNLVGAVLITLGSLGLFNQSNAQTSQNKYRVTELSSWPRKGINQAKYTQGGLTFLTNSEGYINFLTNVDNKDNLEIKLSNISFNNNVMFDNVGKANLVIYNILGQKVKEVNGKDYLIWDLTNNSGKRVAFGSYLYKLENENKIETGLIIPSANSYGNRNLVLKNKSKVNSLNSSLDKLGKKEGTGNVVSCVDTIYCDGRESTRNLEKILMSEFLASKLRKNNGSVVYSVEKDNAYYCIQDTVDSVDKIPSNIQMLEDVDLGKQDGIKFKEYIDMLRPFGVINFGDFETNYPVSVFLDSAYIASKKGGQVSQYLELFRKVLKAANDSIGLNRFKEVNNPINAKIRFDYSRGSYFTVNYYSRDANGNWKTDSCVVYLGLALSPSDDILRVTVEHELGHTHVPNHSSYPEDVMSTNAYVGKTYSKADKYALRALALAKPRTHWKKFVKK